MKKNTNKTQQQSKLIFHHETIATIGSLTAPQLDKVIGGSGSSTQSTCNQTDWV